MTVSLASALASGRLFGCGLAVSGMINPQKVLSFLDFAAMATGDWDPSLALVMASAVATTLAGYALVLRRSRPVLTSQFRLPTNRRSDSRLVAGAALFGLGWGLAGYCPGPALVALGLGASEALVFVASMLAGMYAYERLSARTILEPPTKTATKNHRS